MPAPVNRALTGSVMSEADPEPGGDRGAPGEAPYSLDIGGERRIDALLRRVRLLRESVALARERSWAVDWAFRSWERDGEVGGGILAGAVAYRLFIFSLPLSLFLMSTCTLLAHAFGVDLDAIGQQYGLLGVIAAQVARTGQTTPTAWLATTSLVAAVLVTRSLIRSVTIVHALAWRQPVGASKLPTRSALIFAAAIIGQLGLVIVVGVVRQWAAGPIGLGAVLAMLLAIIAMWWMVSMRLPHGSARARDLLPGACLYGVGVLGVQIFNNSLLERLMTTKSTTYGALGAAAAVLVGFYLIGRLMVGSAVLNASRCSSGVRREL